MKRNTPVTIVLATSVLMVVLAAAWPMEAQDRPAAYPSMAPLNQYLMDRSAEIALARSAAPESISGQAEIQVLGPHGYELAVKGTNGFVCVVERGWMSPFDSADFGIPSYGVRSASTRRQRDLCSPHHQKDEPDISRTVQSASHGGSEDCSEPKRATWPRRWRDELHDVEEGVPDGGWRSQHVSPDDLRPSRRCCVVGRG